MFDLAEGAVVVSFAAGRARTDLVEGTGILQH